MALSFFRRSVRKPTPSPAGLPWCYHPRIEALEKRIVPVCFGPQDVCNTLDSGGNSLRDVINYINTLPPPPPGSAWAIIFDIPGAGVHTIHLNSPLPRIDRPMAIRADSQPGYAGSPVVELDGSRAGPNANGLILNGGDNIVAGLAINNFSASGILMQNGGFNVAAGNYIGTDPRGTTPRPNRVGVTIQDGSSSGCIGLPGLGNLISGNTDAGIRIQRNVRDTDIVDNFIGTDPRGTTAIPNGVGVVLASGASGNRIGGTSQGTPNLISGNRQAGILITDANTQNNSVMGNFIGTNQPGTAALGNRNGVEIRAAGNNQIGVLDMRAGPVGNLISGNTVGVYLDDGAHDNQLLNNTVGTGLTGELALPNTETGVSLQNAVGNTIGGANFPNFGNVISGNGQQGVLISPSGRGNVITANYIGTNGRGSTAVGNGIGVYIQGGSNNTVGGTDSGSRNVISGNQVSGVTVLFGAAGTVIQGNYVGLNAAGNAALPNGVGVTVGQSAVNTTIGGLAAGARNVISGNATTGVLITDSATGTLVENDFIGTNPSGAAPIPNGTNGVAVVRSSNNTIGGAAGNVIAFNGNDGVLVDTGTGNLIQGNSIFGHGNLGIELANGGNLGLLGPFIGDVTVDATLGQTTIDGTLYSTPDTSFTIDFFVNDACNPSGFGEGQTALSSLTGTTDDTGAFSFSLTLPGTIDPSQFVSATATDSANNTSEFAACVSPSTTSPHGRGARPAADSSALASALFTVTAGGAVATVQENRAADATAGLPDVAAELSVRPDGGSVDWQVRDWLFTRSVTNHPRLPAWDYLTDLVPGLDELPG